MRFLGGLLKFLSILLLLIATVGCTIVIVMEGIVNEIPEAIWVMSCVWVLCLFVCLNILGTGMALSQVSKLKKKVQQLEQRGIPAVHAPVEAPLVESFQAPSAAPVADTAPAASGEVAIPAPKQTKAWLPAVIVGAVAVVAIIAVVLIMGGKNKNVVPEPEGPASFPTIAPATEATEAPMEEPSVEDNAVPVPLGGVIEHPQFTMTLDSVELVDEYSYRTSEYSTTSLFVEEGYKLLMLKGTFENIGTSAISSSAFNLTALVNGSYKAEGFDVRMDFERSNSYEIDPYTSFTYVIHVNIPEKLAAMYESAVFTIGFKEDLSNPTITWNMDGTQTVDVDQCYRIAVGTEEYEAMLEAGLIATAPGMAEPEAEPIALGQTIFAEDYEFTLNNVELTYELLPPNTGSVHTSYPAESGKVYVHVDADVKNTMQRDIRIDELFTASVLYDGKYPYEGFTVVNDGDNRFDWVGNYVAATPLETCHAHHLIECPVEVDTSGKSVVVTIHIGDADYQYILR